LFPPDDDYKKRIPIDCRLIVSGKLQNPEIKYDIVLPNATDETRNKLKEVIDNEQVLSTQFMALLVLNNFLPDLNRQQATTTQASVIGRDLATTTSMELLSSQVSSWMSQISNDVDVGFNYRTGNRSLTSQEVEVALSTQLFDDRVSISSNIDFVNEQTTNTGTNKNTNNLVGDVNVEFKLTDKVMLKAFNRANDHLFYFDNVYTRGVGVAYREEFSNFSELGKLYKARLFGTKKDAKQTQDTLQKN
jgi:hypothetical protein